MPADRKDTDPYCGNCGHTLVGLVDSSKCPECGKPLVEVLRHQGQWGKRFRSRATVFGLPAIDIALGPAPGERIGKARGVIAIGDHAKGIVAIGGVARGIVAFGGMAIGLFAMGGMALGLLTAWGGLALALMANGGVSIGLLAAGGLAIGGMAVGGLAIGYFAAGGQPVGAFKAGPGGNAPEVVEALQQCSWYFGTSGASFGAGMLIQPLFTTIGLPIVVAVTFALIALVAHSREPTEEERREALESE